MPSSLTTLLPLALGSSPHLPVSVYGTGACNIRTPFLATDFLHFPTYNFSPFRPGLPTPGMEYVLVSVYLNVLVATESLPFVHRLRLAASP